MFTTTLPTLHGKYIIMQAICTHFANIIQSKMQHYLKLTVMKFHQKFRVIKPISSSVCVCVDYYLLASVGGLVLISCINLGVQKFIVHAWRHMCRYTFCGFLLKYLLHQIIQNYIRYALKNISKPNFFSQKVFFIVDESFI